MGTIRHSEVQAWVTELTARKGATTVLRAYGILAALLDIAVKDRRISSNPARGVNLPRKVQKDHLYLSHDEDAALARAPGDRSTLILVLAYCGLRWGEAIGLEVRDLDLARRRININRNAVEVGGRSEPRGQRRRKREIGAADTRSRLCGDDPGHLRGPLRCRPRRRCHATESGRHVFECCQNVARGGFRPRNNPHIPLNTGKWGKARAETVGFEPTVPREGYSTLAGWCTKPYYATSPWCLQRKHT